MANETQRTPTDKKTLAQRVREVFPTFIPFMIKENAPHKLRIKQGESGAHELYAGEQKLGALTSKTGVIRYDGKLHPDQNIKHRECNITNGAKGLAIQTIDQDLEGISLIYNLEEKRRGDYWTSIPFP